MVKHFQITSELDVDSMFFHSALTSLSVAQKNKNISDKKITELGSISWLNKYEEWIGGDEIDEGFSNKETNYIEELKHNIEKSFSIFFQSTASTHIFCVETLEAHINNIARSSLTKNELEYFEKFSLEGKWLILPCILHKNTFTLDDQLFHDFSRLIKRKNALLRHKNITIHYHGKSGATNLYKPIGLTIEDAVNSVETTTKMICELAKLIEHEAPVWIKNTAPTFHRVEVGCQ